MGARVLAVLLAVFTVPPTLLGIAVTVIWLDSGSISVRNTASVAVGASPAVSVRVGAGVVTIGQGPVGQVSLVDRDTVRGLSRTVADAALKRLSSTLRATAGGASVNVPSEFPSLQDLSLGGPTSQGRDVTILVPPGSSLRLDSGPGVIHLAQLAGPVDVSGSAGVVVLQGFKVTGVSRIRLTNGGIAGTISMAGGSLDAAVVSGGIRLVLRSAGGTQLRATSANGSVDLPRSFGIGLQKFGSSEAATGVVGGGPATSGSLTLDTVNGVISLSRR